MFTLGAMSIDSWCPFGEARTVKGSKICRSIYVGRFVVNGCSAAIDLSNAAPLTMVSVAVTGMVLPFLRTVVHCFTESELAPDTPTSVILGDECVGVEVGAEFGRGVRVVHCGARLPVACCLWVCLSTAVVVTAGSKINGSGVVVARGGLCRGALPTTVL